MWPNVPPFSFCNSVLKVYTVGPSGTSLLMWVATGNHGNQWAYANVILSNSAPFRVTFQTEVGGDMWTDIALDDISYTIECMVGGKAITVFFFFLSVVFLPLHLQCAALLAMCSLFMLFTPMLTFYR